MIGNILHWVLNRKWCWAVVVLCAYGVSLLGSLWLSFAVRFDFSVPASEHQRFAAAVVWMVPVRLLFLMMFMKIRGSFLHCALSDLRRLAAGIVLPTWIFLCLWWALSGGGVPPRGVLLVDTLVSFTAVAAIHLGFRLIRQRYLSGPQPSYGRVQRVAIIGAGDAGALLAREFLSKATIRCRPVAFFDDDTRKWNMHVHNIPVVGNPEKLVELKARLKLDRVILAMPSAGAGRVREIVRLLQSIHVPFETVPSLDQLATGKVKVTRLRPVRIEDVIGRKRIQLDERKVRNVVQGKVIMVTGAGGSVGGELCRQLARFEPAQLLLIEQCEVKIFQIEQEMIEMGCGNLIVPLVADILDAPRMQLIFEKHKPHLVFHAAAHTNAELIEINPSEGIKTNCFGTVRLSALAVEFGVERFIQVSSKRALRSRTALGASRRLAELVVEAMAGQDADTHFRVVRLGEVVGAADSLMSAFSRQIAAGGPVKISNANACHHFMTVAEGVTLLLKAVADHSGEAVVNLENGRPIRLLDLACRLIELSGLQPNRDIEIEFVDYGKESGSSARSSSLEDQDASLNASGTLDWARLKKALREMEPKVDFLESDELKQWMHQLIADHQPKVSEPAPVLQKTTHSFDKVLAA